MRFMHKGSEARIYRISSGIKLDGMYGDQLCQHNFLTSFDNDTEYFLLNFIVCT